MQHLKGSRSLFYGCFLMVGLMAGTVFGLTTGVRALSAGVPPLDVNQVLDGITASYTESGFSADFMQTSTLEVMNMTDTASGRLLAKKPDKMRWEYHSPEPQTIITDGSTLWIYRPQDRQVMIGRAPVFFGDGKGAGFLSDVSRLKDQFNITPAPGQSSREHRLLLEPRQAHPDMAQVLLVIDAETFRIVAVETRNQFGDTTLIEFFNFKPEINPDNNLFHFEIPAGVDIIQIDEQ